jgi:hypothetical protein
LFETSEFCADPFAPPEKVKAALRSDIEQRLRKACSEWSEEEFQTLVDDATAIALKYVTFGSSYT